MGGYDCEQPYPETRRLAGCCHFVSSHRDYRTRAIRHASLLFRASVCRGLDCSAVGTTPANHATGDCGPLWRGDCSGVRTGTGPANPGDFEFANSEGTDNFRGRSDAFPNRKFSSGASPRTADAAVTAASSEPSSLGELDRTFNRAGSGNCLSFERIARTFDDDSVTGKSSTHPASRSRARVRDTPAWRGNDASKRWNRRLVR